MDKKYFDAIISEMKVLLDGQNFSLDGEIYKNEQKAVKIEYNEETKLFNLLVAEVNEGEVSEFSCINSWYFDETQNERDALAVGVDFADTLRGNLGLKKERGAAKVELPVADKGDTATISALTQKLLAIFPQFKETYKESVAEYNKFLYLDFFTVNFVPAIKNLFETGTKKQLKKLFDMLSDMYNTGNGETTDAIVALVCAAIYNNEKGAELFREHAAENKHMQTAVREFSNVLAKSKKLQASLIK